MLYGHGAQQALFTELVRSGELGHAYLFFGDRGIGKRTFASALATQLETGSFDAPHAPLVDYALVEPDEQGTIGIDAARAVRALLSETPLFSARRTVVIDATTAPTDEAQGALLKIVEEPPQSALIICVIHDPTLLTPALRSRFSQIYFARFSTNDIAEYVTTSCAIPTVQAESIARRSFGSIARARVLAGVDVDTSAFEPSLAQKLSTRAVALYERDVRANASTIRLLTHRIALLEELNLNEVLHERAIEALVGRSVY
jgi:DNA polymerase-3 subunit delta'